jgi:hypothetical protein
MNDPTPPIPLTEAERLHYQSEAEKGKYPTLEIVRRFIATIRTSIKNSPAKLAKTAKTRTKKAEATDEDIEGFF